MKGNGGLEAMKRIAAVTMLGMSLALIGSLSGCGKKPPATVVPVEDDAAARQRMLDSLRAAEREPAAPEPEKVVVKPEPEFPLILQDVHFDTDKAILTELAASIMSDNALALSQHAKVKVQIEGHCDERGSNEYNLALGERRAQTVKNYLVNYGISNGRLSTISYGEERPVDPGHDERAWQKNRRVHMRVVEE
jgi:peptidoglycan-associated lipoprotein